MKRCPECRRDYHDDSLLYCLEDGTALIQGSVPSPEEPQTAILNDTGDVGRATAATAIQPLETSGTTTANRGFQKRYLAVAVLLAIVALGGVLGYRYLSFSGAKPIG